MPSHACNAPMPNYDGTRSRTGIAAPRRPLRHRGLAVQRVDHLAAAGRRGANALAHGVADDRIDVAWTPGAFEIPTVANRLAASGRYAAVLCLGAVIRGETTHDQHINRAVSTALCEIGVHYGLPVLVRHPHLQHARTGHRPLRRPGRHHRQGRPAAHRQQGRRLRHGRAGNGRSDGQIAGEVVEKWIVRSRKRQITESPNP